MKSRFRVVMAFQIAVALSLALLGGCGSMPVDHGRGEVAALLGERGYAVPADVAAAQVSAERADTGTLTVAAAVHRALLGNPALRAEYARLGFAAAEVYDAGRPGNPRLELSYLFVESGALDDELAFGLTQNFTDLLMLSARRRLAEAEFRRVRYAVGAAVQRLVGEVMHAYYDRVGAAQSAAFQDQAAAAAEAAAELARRYHGAGNITRRELLTVAARASEARLDALAAEQALDAAHARLAGLLGDSGAAPPVLIDALPAPAAVFELPELLELAGRSRLDLEAARQRVALREDELGVTRRFRFLGGGEIGPRMTRDKDGTRHIGPQLALELPVFNRGAGKLVRAAAELEHARAALQEREVDVANEVRVAAAALHNAFARAELHRSDLVPQRREIVERIQQEVNFMLEGPFELLRAKQQEYLAQRGHADAVRDYWLAYAELSRAVGTALPERVPLPGRPQAGQPAPRDPADPAPAPDEPPAEPGDADPHLHHHGEH